MFLCKIIKYINQSEYSFISQSGTWSIYSINYMFRPLHWPSSDLYLTYQVTIRNAWCSLGWWGLGWVEDEISFTKLWCMKIWTLDRIANILCQYPDFTCLRTNKHCMLQSTVSSTCWVAWGSPVSPIALCVVSDELRGCIINLSLRYRWGWFYGWGVCF